MQNYINMPKIAITFPIYINNEDHFYFTKKTLDSIKTKHDYEVYVVENYVNKEFRDKVDTLYSDDRISSFINPTGNNVSAAWNLGIETAFSRSIDIVLVPNNDIIFHPECIDNLVEFTNNEEFVMWTALEHGNLRGLLSADVGTSYDNHPGFSLFAVTRSGINKLKEMEKNTFEPLPGMFDPGYDKAYFEDQDFHQRILRAGFDAGKTSSARYYHFGSRTIKVDESLNNENFITYEKNRRYFEHKWGYDSHGKAPNNKERVEWGYKTAFNK